MTEITAKELTHREVSRGTGGLITSAADSSLLKTLQFWKAWSVAGGRTGTQRQRSRGSCLPRIGGQWAEGAAAPSFPLESRKLDYPRFTRSKTRTKMSATRRSGAPAIAVPLQATQRVGVAWPKLKHRRILSHAALVTSRQPCHGRKQFICLETAYFDR